MVDKFTPEARSRLMARIRGIDTKPELFVRRLAHRMGFRFRLHRRDLPGTPDLVFPRLRSVIFVHGCFWHGHACGWKAPSKTRIDYWRTKIVRNQARDKRVLAEIARLGWQSLVIWECETRRPELLEQRLRRFLIRRRRNWNERNKDSSKR